MEQVFNEHGKLPACRISREFLADLWKILGQDGEFLWQIIVGTGDDILGKLEERPQEIITDWNRLLELLDSSPRIDTMQITAEIEGKGAVSMSFRNFAPAGGAMIISSSDAEWAAARFDQIYDLFEAAKDETANRLYNRWVFGLIQTLIPMSIAFVIVILVTGVITPAWLRHGEFLWWLTAGTVVATLRVAFSISNWLVVRCLTKHHYIRWVS
jgi:hypothetical protein